MDGDSFSWRKKEKKYLFTTNDFLFSGKRASMMSWRFGDILFIVMHRLRYTEYVYVLVCLWTLIRIPDEPFKKNLQKKR